MQERDEAVLVFILHPLGYGGLDVFERACRQAHLFHLREDTVQLALRERDHQRWLVALSRIPRAEFSGPRGAAPTCANGCERSDSPQRNLPPTGTAMANLSFNSSLSLDLGLSGISHQARESVRESLPALREIAPLEEAARNNLEVLLAKPNLASLHHGPPAAGHRRQRCADPGPFQQGLQRACADLAGLRPADSEPPRRCSAHSAP